MNALLRYCSCRMHGRPVRLALATCLSHGALKFKQRGNVKLTGIGLQEAPIPSIKSKVENLLSFTARQLRNASCGVIRNR